ncbi:MAG: hypothetical protein FWG63_02345 [Defluviitaleaceae bacterium]|nr:hypothetical protein [Defluviitaleaceae bacterium]
MDIYSFFNSPDVAEHCKNIGHTFNAFESAVIINQCYTKSFDERISAYRDIISEYPDMEVPPVFHYEKHTESFHKVLEQIISCEERTLEKFLEHETGAVYRVRFNRNTPHDDYENTVYTVYEKALNDVLEEIKGEEEADEGLRIHPKILNVTIQKRYLDSDDCITAMISKSGSIMTIDIGYCRRGSHDEREPLDILDCYIHVPTPFKKGDLVEYDLYDSSMGNVFVIQELSHDSPRHESSIMRSDTNDMIAWVYYQSDGQVNCECMHFYPNLRYCKRELVGDESILKYVSLFVQDKICLCELLAAQKFLLADKIRTEQIDNFPGNTISPDIQGLLENFKKKG